MGAFNSLNHPLRFFCLVLFLCLSVSHIDVVPLPSHSQYLVSFSISVSVFFCVCIPLFSVSCPLSVSDPLLCLRLGDQQELLSVKSPILIVARLPSSSRDGFSLFLSSSLPTILPSSLLICSGSLHSTACFILPWLTLVLIGPSVDLNNWTQSYRRDHTFAHCLWYCTTLSKHSKERVIDYW